MTHCWHFFVWCCMFNLCLVQSFLFDLSAILFEMTEHTNVQQIWFLWRSMGALQTPVICPANHAKVALAGSISVNAYRPKFGERRAFLGFDKTFMTQFKVCAVPCKHHRKNSSIQCTFSSSSNGNGSTAENFNEDEEYVNSSVLEAGMYVLS